MGAQWLCQDSSNVCRNVSVPARGMLQHIAKTWKAYSTACEDVITRLRSHGRGGFPLHISNIGPLLPYANPFNAYVFQDFEGHAGHLCHITYTLIAVRIAEPGCDCSSFVLTWREASAPAHDALTLNRKPIPRPKAQLP